MVYTVSALFDGEPSQWGLRGDPYMWRDLQERFASTPLPETADELEVLIKGAFWAIIEAEASRDASGNPKHWQKRYWIERFSHGGLSSGSVSMYFWDLYGFPMLVERFNHYRATSD
ncbi:hypothetical protein GC425_07245 [Corynebacterium sp. zg254]|uniref:Uncharacterized protein n=1 Tax=Corynebacterium zhongnanshanii TaxID=2768834 RepID=A0ABQ6VDK7_9CORY|nr:MULTISPECIES: hypothetical protein [Corynebacterium]KAB3521010.1 hypothetical protein F8377_07265 [Corynebacterium zhongnanshanii]MCR5914651.1 hypothetical protein [Corynebacterium sp. zg254]